MTDAILRQESAPPVGGLLRKALGELRHKRNAQVGLCMLGLVVTVAILAPLIAPYSPTEVLFDAGVAPRQSPCVHLFGCADELPQHVLGIDGNGRDFFSRLVFGTRASLFAGFAAVTFAVVVGTLLGLIAGFFGGFIDNLIMRMMDVLLAFPSLLLAIAVVVLLGPGLFNAIIAISIVTIPIYARIVRASVLQVREQDFVTADRALGVPVWRLLFHRVFPNSMTALVVAATLGIASAVLDIAGLSFIGLGTQPPTPEWGSMLAEERNQVFTAPHLVFFPGFAIMWNVLAFNLLGDGLRDALDPRLAK